MCLFVLCVRLVKLVFRDILLMWILFCRVVLVGCVFVGSMWLFVMKVVCVGMCSIRLCGFMLLIVINGWVLSVMGVVELDWFVSVCVILMLLGVIVYMIFVLIRYGYLVCGMIVVCRMVLDVVCEILYVVKWRRLWLVLFSFGLVMVRVCVVLLLFYCLFCIWFGYGIRIILEYDGVG